MWVWTVDGILAEAIMVSDWRAFTKKSLGFGFAMSIAVSLEWFETGMK